MTDAASVSQKQDFDRKLTQCVFCGSDGIAHYDRDFTGKTIDRCPACGAMFMNPQYSDAYLADYYTRYIGPAAKVGEADFEQANRWRFLIHDYYLSLIERHVRPGRLLSVGCGDGLELAVAKERGWEPEGFEVDPAACEEVTARLGVKVTGGEFGEAPYSPESFDCIYLHQVIEHPKNPQDYLRRINGLLKPGGVLFIACPNIRSLSNRVKTLTGRLGLKKRRGRHYDTWHHLFYYSPRVLSRILEWHYVYRTLCVGNGFGDKARQFTAARIRRECALNRFLPCWKDVFVLLATKGHQNDTEGKLQ